MSGNGTRNLKEISIRNKKQRVNEIRKEEEKMASKIKASEKH